MGTKPQQYPQLSNLDNETQLAVRRAFDAINKTNADLQSLAAAHITLQQQVRNAQNQTVETQQKVASLPSFDILQSGTSSQLKMQGSVLPAHNTGFTYTTTTTSITFYWDGTNGSSQIQIAWPDGSTTLVPLSRIAITGLSAGTTYNFYPFYDTQLNTVHFAPQGSPPNCPNGVGTPPVAYTAPNIFAAAAADGDRMQALSNGPIVVATPGSGTTSGSAGGK